MLERLRDFVQQRITAHWLCDDREPWIDLTRVSHRRNDDDWNVRRPLIRRQRLDGGETAPARQHEIHQDQVWLPLDGDSQGGLAVARFQCAVAGRLQERAQHAPHVSIVVDDEDRASGGGLDHGRDRRSRYRRLRRSCRGWKRYDEAGSLAKAALDSD